MSPDNESCVTLVNTRTENELNIHETNPLACDPQGLVCRLLDGTWILDGSVSLC